MQRNCERGWNKVKDVEIGEKKERELLIFIEGWRKLSFITLTSSSTTYICVKMINLIQYIVYLFWSSHQDVGTRREREREDGLSMHANSHGIWNPNL